MQGQRPRPGVEFTTTGNHNHDSGKINGSLETKYKWSEYGMHRIGLHHLFIFEFLIPYYF